MADVLPFLRCKATTMQYTYDDIWNIILKMEPIDDTWFPGAFVDWDNTPRRKIEGRYVQTLRRKNLKSIYPCRLKGQGMFIIRIIFSCLHGMNGVNLDI